LKDNFPIFKSLIFITHKPKMYIQNYFQVWPFSANPPFTQHYAISRKTIKSHE